MRLTKLSVLYNVGIDNLVNFLIRNGYKGKIASSIIIEQKYIDLIDAEFNSDKKLKDLVKKQNQTKFGDYKSDELKKIPKNYTKRIVVEGSQSLTYKELFGECFWGCKHIVCVDPYIRQTKQFKNLLNLISIIKQFSINKISFQLLTCFDKGNAQSQNTIEIELNKVKNKTEGEYFSFSYSIEKPDFYHDRYIYVDDKFIVDLSRGLDIFQSLKDADTVITKPSTIFITRLK